MSSNCTSLKPIRSFYFDRSLIPDFLKQVNIEEVLSVEISTSRAVGVNACVPITALVKGISHRYLSTSREPEWRSSGDVTVNDRGLCGLREGSGRVRAALAGVWSQELEVCA